MNRYVKIRYNGVVNPSWLLWVDQGTQWSLEQIASENAKAVEIAKMAFLDHGTPTIPIDSLDEVLGIKAAYLSQPDSPVLVSEGGTFMSFLPGMEVHDEVFHEFYPIDAGAAVVCENDPFDKYGGAVDHWSGMARFAGVGSVHVMYSFRCRTEPEIVSAFRGAPAIMFNSSHTEADWFELMLRCIIISGTKARIIGSKQYKSNLSLDRFNLCVEFAAKFGVVIEPYG